MKSKKFNNKTEAGQFICVTRQAITNYIKRNTPLKNILKIKKNIKSFSVLGKTKTRLCYHSLISDVA